MAVKIRLSRIGKKHVPFFRLVVVDSRKKRDGASLANLGTYDALKSKVIQFNETLYHEWVKKGAIPSDSVKRVYRLYKRGSSIEIPKQGASKKSANKIKEVQATSESIETTKIN